MIPVMAASPADRRLLLEGRSAGPMPWVIAIMLFLTTLAVAAGIAMGGAAARLGSGLADQLTVQIVEADPDARAAQASAALAALRADRGVASATRVSDGEVARLLAPWLGQASAADEIPVPALIDVTLGPGGDADLLAARLAHAAPAARIDQSGRALAPLAALIRALALLAVALVALMAAAAAAAVVLAARAALNTHGATIATLHLLGATDVQIARLFQRRLALDAMFGSLVGAVGGIAIILLLGARIAAVGSALLGAIALPIAGWLLLALLPPATMLLATLAARLTVLGALRQML